METPVVPRGYTHMQDCGGITAYLVQEYRVTGASQNWQCYHKPKPLPPRATCPCSTFQESMHSMCYSSYQQCIGANNKTYFTAILQNNKSPTISDDNKYLQAGCTGTPGTPVCWNTRAPTHMSDGGGPQDAVRQIETRRQIEEAYRHLYPQLSYHPLILPKVDPSELDSQTMSILEATFALLNTTNPNLAQDCWLCLPQGPPRPIAIPTFANLNISERCNPTSLPEPFPIQFSKFSTTFNTSCFVKNDSLSNASIDLGILSSTGCSQYIPVNSSLCSPNTTVFVCGSNLAYTYLPLNWTGVCTLATLLPNVDLISGDTPLPIPSFDLWAGRTKRAITVLPLLVGLGITGAVATGSTGLGVSLHSYSQLSRQLIEDVETLSGTIQDLQDQLDSLAEVVLQNRRGLDLLTAEQGGICLALKEKCCFYANKSGIVRNKIHQLQEDLARRRQELADNPLWSGFHGMLPFLLPILGPLLCLLLLLTIGPCILSKVMNFVRERINTVQLMILRTQYQPCEASEIEETEP
ncbi:syncytin-1-like [Delphinus delphis]|uniref:syncytin-1-like n=1 Tax=Delphinus delphis TaxID=9728 RepID=UPI0028C3DCAB|nr:syncytin-1-like [Delphinus delphis]